MGFCIRLNAPAKINLHLKVLGIRLDGYHNIVSIFQAIDLSDKIIMCSLKEENALEIQGDFDCPPSQTTIHAAVQAFRKDTGWKCGLSIRIDKQIPAGAGMGGGSSDAASVLRGLNFASGKNLCADHLSALASVVGSDVPFFLGTCCALVEGRGEHLLPVTPRTDFHVVVVFPGFSVSTKTAFRLLDNMVAENGGFPEYHETRLVEQYLEYPHENWFFTNDFQTSLSPAFPVFRDLNEILKGEGADFTSLSGSGSTVFGVFKNQDLADAAVRSVKLDALRKASPNPERWCIRRCSPLASWPELSYDDFLDKLDREECRDNGNHGCTGS